MTFSVTWLKAGLAREPPLGYGAITCGSGLFTVRTNRPLLLLVAALALALAVSMRWGLPSGLPLSDDIFWHLRLPRVGLAAFAGASLALAGLLLQDLFRNPLVEPGLLGVSAGAGLATVTAMVLGFGGPLLLPLAAFGGAMAALVVVLAIAHRTGNGSAPLLLVGVAVNALAGALVQLLLSVGNNELLRSASFWLMGSFAQADSTLLLPALLVLAAVTGWAVRRAGALDVWQLGDAEAGHLGLEVGRFRLALLLLSSLLVALAVCQSGGIGFIGLLAPHMVRRIGLSSHREQLPATLIVGALLAVLADLLARGLIAPLELPVGVLTALLGAPSFLLLFLREQRA
ncbi:MAG TPA: iron ABC transporter permease [Moraxellaceae bacterium]|nr:iron ABC transporter permease [Moraxellaceae bacterium]